MENNFQTALNFVLEYEGGWANDPDDPGGATNQGITLATYQHYFPGTDKGELRYMLDEERNRIYRAGYWDTNGISTLPSGFDLCVFDAGVMSGPARAVMWLQELVGSAPDGVVGPRTLACLTSIPLATEVLLHKYRNRRIDFYSKLQHWPKYKNGWTKRADAAEEAGKTLHAHSTMPDDSEAMPTQFDIYAAAYISGVAIRDGTLDDAFEFARLAVQRRKDVDTGG